MRPRSCPVHRAGSAAIVVPLANTTDYLGMAGDNQIDSALLVSASLLAIGSSVPLVALTHGYSRPAVRQLRRACFTVEDVSHIPLELFAKRARLRPEPFFKWPRMPQAHRVQHRTDAAGLSLKLLAWNLTQYPALLMVDSDVVFLEDPAPWLEKRVQEDEYFLAYRETFSRNYRGINMHLTFLRPAHQVYRILRDAAVGGNWIPYTNGIQDVIEEVFTPHRDFPELAHLHAHSIFCTCASLIALPQVAELADDAVDEWCSDDGPMRAPESEPTPSAMGLTLIGERATQCVTLCEGRGTADRARRCRRTGWLPLLPLPEARSCPGPRELQDAGTQRCWDESRTGTPAANVRGSSLLDSWLASSMDWDEKRRNRTHRAGKKRRPAWWLEDEIASKGSTFAMLRARTRQLQTAMPQSKAHNY